MLKVNCEACGAPYEVDPRRVPATGLKMRCPACGASVQVMPEPAAMEPILGDLDLDLPAPKANAAKKHKGTALGLGMPVAAPPKLDEPTFGVQGGAALAAAPDLSDLPAPKNAPKAAPFAMGPPPAPGLDLDDLPAPKGKVKPQTPSLGDLDLPAPKPRAAAGKIAPSFEAPDAFGAPGLDIDLPAPKGVADLPAPRDPKAGLADLPAPKASGLADLPAPKAAGFTDLPAPKAGGLTDLPAPKPAGFTDLPAPKGGFADLPAPVDAGAPDLPAPGGFDIDLPAPRGPKGAFQRPGGAGVQPRPAEPGPARAMPKDSLAMDPQPFFAAGRGGALADLDDFGPGGKAPQAPGHVDLPAPRDLPAAKPKGRTQLGLGNKLAKDSLDIPGGSHGFEAPAEIVGSPFLDEEDLPAPADLPAPRGMAPGPDFDLPAPNDLPVVKPLGPGNIDLPAPNDLPRAKMDAPLLDLPAPDNLPKVRHNEPMGTAMGIGPGIGKPGRIAPETNATDLGIGPMMLDSSLDLPPSAPANDRLGFGTQDFDLGQSRTGNTFGSTGALDLGLDLPPSRQDQSNSIIDLNSLALPGADPKKGARSFHGTMDLSGDDLELPDRASNVLSLPSADRGSVGGLPLPSMGDLDLFGNSGGGAPKQAPRGQTIELDGMFELGSSVAVESMGTSGRVQTQAGGNFGELDFGLSGTDAAVQMPKPAMPQPVPAAGAPGAFESVEAELLGGAEMPAPTKKKKKKTSAAKAIPAWIWPIVLLLLIAGSGVGSGLFTEHGYFGVYFVERLLAAGDPVRVGAAIEQAEKQAKTDTYLDVRKSLVTLSDARNEAGLNRELLARSLLHEALYQLRFGEDPQSAQRSVAILSRLMERGGEVPGLPLARAADTARRGDIAPAVSLLKQARADKDPYRALVTGEIRLLEKKPEDALKAFTDAEKLGGSARARWGKARALLALDKKDEAELAAKATLELSPRHAGAHVLLAERALERGDAQTAIDLTRKANGSIKIDGGVARPAKADMTRAWALMGKIEEKLEHPKEAQAAYERALAADPLRVDVLLGSGRMLMRLGRPRDALSRYDSAISAKPSDKPDARGTIPLIEAATGAAQALLALERPQEALQRLAVPKFEKHPELTLWKGHCYTGLEKWDEAEEAFKTTIEVAPTSFAGYVAMSQLLFKRERPEEAARVLTEATSKVEDSAEVRRMLGHSELNRHHLPEAIHQFEAALRFDPRDAGALGGLVIAQRKNGGIEAAEKALDRLEKVDPSFPSLSLERGLLMEIRGNYEGAIDVYRKALEERKTDTDLRLRLGAALVTAGHVDEADGMLKQVLKERPNSAEAEHFVGRVLFARKDTAQAVQRFQRAVTMDPGIADYQLYLAWALLEQGNMSGALESINKALERDPNIGDAHWLMGRIQLRTGAVKDALQSFLDARRLKPGRVEALAGMGDAYDQLRQLDKAVDAYKEATKAQPQNGEWWFRLGSLELDRGNQDEARVNLAEATVVGDKLIEKPHWLADAHRVYADLLRQGGRTPEALIHYKQFLTLSPADHPSRNEVAEIVKSGTR
jgi:tetratricopeptide (TPR) repeat protein